MEARAERNGSDRQPARHVHGGREPHGGRGRVPEARRVADDAQVGDQGCVAQQRPGRAQGQAKHAALDRRGAPRGSERATEQIDLRPGTVLGGARLPGYGRDQGAEVAGSGRRLSDDGGEPGQVARGAGLVTRPGVKRHRNPDRAAAAAVGEVPAADGHDQRGDQHVIDGAARLPSGLADGRHRLGLQQPESGAGAVTPGDRPLRGNTRGRPGQQARRPDRLRRRHHGAPAVLGSRRLFRRRRSPAARVVARDAAEQPEAGDTVECRVVRVQDDAVLARPGSEQDVHRWRAVQRGRGGQEPHPLLREFLFVSPGGGGERVAVRSPEHFPGVPAPPAPRRPADHRPWLRRERRAGGPAQRRLIQVTGNPHLDVHIGGLVRCVVVAGQLVGDAEGRSQRQCPRIGARRRHTERGGLEVRPQHRVGPRAARRAGHRGPPMPSGSRRVPAGNGVLAPGAGSGRAGRHPALLAALDAVACG